MTDPKLAADEATHKITVALVTAGIAPEVAKAVAPAISAHVLAAITRCICAPSHGLNDK